MKCGTRSSHHLVLSFVGAGEGMRALDVGRARDNFLEELKSSGWKCLGIDTDAADITNDPPERPAMFVLGDVLEHLPDPLRVLRKVHSLLNPGTRIVVSVPNVAHWR